MFARVVTSRKLFLESKLFSMGVALFSLSFYTALSDLSLS